MSPDAVTRHHVDVHGRRVHYRRTGHGPAVVLLHASPRSSAALLPLIGMAPPGATVLAFDAPGCGDSEPIAAPNPEPGDYGDALAETLTVLGVDRAPVYGTHTGAAIAIGFAVRHPQRATALVLDGLSVFDAGERAWLADYLPPFVPRLDGTHLTWLWSRLRDQQLFFPWHQPRTSTRLWRPLPAPEQLHAAALDLLRAGDAHRAPYAAAFRFQPNDWLDRLPMPVFIGAREDDLLLPHLARLTARPPQLRTATLPADAAAWGERIWAELLCHCGAGDPAVPAAVDRLPHDRLGSAFIGPAGSRVHLRGALGGRGRPRVLLHDSPGASRGLDAPTLRAIAEGPMLAIDLPAHGDSDGWSGPMRAAPLAHAVLATLRSLGVDEADVEGIGTGGWVAAACARAAPRRFHAAAGIPPGQGAVPADAFTPRADGGHLQAAWLHARDEVVFGPAWTRDPSTHHDFGERIDPAAVHRDCVDALKEAPEAAALRRGLFNEARVAAASGGWTK